MNRSLFVRLSLLIAGFTLAVSAWAANPRVEVRTSQGRIVIELYPEKAPGSVENFLRYANEKFYDGTVFHRVIDGFMIQGGGFDEKMQQKPTREPIANESANGLRNEPGTVAMARRAPPNSATSQFYINLGDNAALNHPGRDGSGYAVFGKVTQGMDVVQRIAKVPTGDFGTRPVYRNVPVEPVVIQSVRVLPAAAGPARK